MATQFDPWARRIPLRAENFLEFFADESSQTKHRYMVLGAVLVPARAVVEVEQRFAALRPTTKPVSEMKWTKVSKHNIREYEAWVELFFELSKLLRFSSVVIDASQFDHRTYNEGDSEIGFNKVLYQFLLHSIGTKYGYVRPIRGYLDARTTVHTPERLRLMLNGGLRKIHANKYWDMPFRELSFLDSSKSALLQLTDILIGAIAFDRNLHWTRPDSRPEKLQLCRRILDFAQTKPGRSACKVWEFQFRQKRGGGAGLQPDLQPDATKRGGTGTD
jgi:hypothetical protein